MIQAMKTKQQPSRLLMSQTNISVVAKQSEWPSDRKGRVPTHGAGADELLSVAK